MVSVADFWVSDWLEGVLEIPGGVEGSSGSPLLEARQRVLEGHRYRYELIDVFSKRDPDFTGICVEFNVMFIVGEGEIADTLTVPHG